MTQCLISWAGVFEFLRFEERFRKFKFRFRDGVGADGRP